MGSYTELTVGGYLLLTTKSYAHTETFTIFRESGKRVFDRRISIENPLIPGTPANQRNEIETVVLYQSTAATVAQRLDIMGFTLDQARREFESLRLQEIEELSDLTDDFFVEERRLLEGLSFDKYARNLRKIMALGLRPYLYGGRKEKRLSKFSRYILESDFDHLLGFFASDFRSLIRLTCGMVDPNSPVELDLTDVVSGGYYDRDESICANALSELTSAYHSNSKQILLAEGHSDTEIIKEALMLLYPHLADYYSIFDFNLSRPQGGAGQLVGTIKAFIAAGISNRIIALLDNDTAAREARRALDRLPLPHNFAVLHYPALEGLRKYPTQGPTGRTLFDVNGLAGSIELYLGDDVLSRNGARAPVQWRGFSETMGTYQGEVMHKAEIQAAFWEKVKRCRTDGAAMRTADWTGLNAILNAIFTAFGGPGAQSGNKKADPSGSCWRRRRKGHG